VTPLCFSLDSEFVVLFAFAIRANSLYLCIRMKWRRISEEEVRLVLTSPEKIEPTVHGRTNAYLHTAGRYLKVTYKETDDEILIISVVDKYD